MNPRSRWIAIFLCAVTLAASAFAQTDKKPQYEIYAVRYAIIPDFPVSALVKGADPSRKLDIAMTVWLVKGNGRNILVDSGFYRDKFFKDWKGKDFIDEYAYYTGEAWQHPRTHGGIDPDDVLALVKANMEGRVGMVDGDNQEIIPGVTCYIGGKHTFQSQYVGVSGKAGTVVLASDNMYLYENLDKHVPIAATLDADSNLRAQDRMKQLAGDPKRIIPGHDPAVFERFPKVNERAVKIE